jgi:hypothetical protein
MQIQYSYVTTGGNASIVQGTTLWYLYLGDVRVGSFKNSESAAFALSRGEVRWPRGIDRAAWTAPTELDSWERLVLPGVPELL